MAVSRERSRDAMIAVDTNVLVHLLTRHDRQQAAEAAALFATEQVWIAKSVLFETNWELKRVHSFPATAVRSAFIMLLGLPNVQLEDEESVAAALDLSAKGIDLADALH